MDAKGKEKKKKKKKMANVVKKEASALVDSDYEHNIQEEEEEEEEDNGNMKKKGIVLKKDSKYSSGGGSGLRNCQVENCMADLSDAKPYHKRHKVCGDHAKAQVVFVGGIRQRFCQQCSRFHDLLEFDETKRSCRSRLAGHNERRRKKAAESNGEGSSLRGTGSQLKDIACGQADDKGGIEVSFRENRFINITSDHSSEACSLSSVNLGM